MKNPEALKRLLSENINDASLTATSLLALEAIIGKAEKLEYRPVRAAFINVVLFRELFQLLFQLDVSIEPVVPRDRPPYMTPDAFNAALQASLYRTLGVQLNLTFGALFRREVGPIIMERLAHEIENEVVCHVANKKLHSNLSDLLLSFCAVCRVGDLALAKNLRRLFSLVIESPIIGESSTERDTWLVQALT